MSEAPEPKKFGRAAREPAPSGLDLSGIHPTPAPRPSAAPMELPGEYQSAPTPRRRRIRETKSKSVTMRITPTTYTRFNDYCDREQLSYPDALDRLLSIAEGSKD